MEHCEIIAMQNDLFRRFHLPPDGAKKCKEAGVQGTFVLTEGVSHKGLEFQIAALQSVAEFEGFEDGNNPYGERDFGSLDVLGCRIFWKIDYYDLTLKAGSEEPHNLAITKRVLTLMLPEEY